MLIYLLKISENVTKTIDINTQETSTLVKNQPRKQFDNTNVKNKTFNANKVTDNNFNELSDNQQNLSNQKFVFSKERDDKIMRMAKEEVLSKAFQDKTLVKMGFNQEAVTKLDADNPDENLFSIKDAPPKLRNLIESQLAEDKKRGYSEMSNEAMSRRINAAHYILGSYPIKSTTFAPADIPEYVANNYDYIGYTFPGASYGDGLNIMHGTLWRVYQDKNAGHIVLLQESGHGKYAGSYTFKETINENVLGYSAKYLLFKSPNGQSFTLLTWKIKSYGFALHFIGLPNGNNKSILMKFAEELIKTNKGKDSELKLQ
ncbi:MAG: hypothetical protein FE834_04045 [Gammaproteobacteria bacterium]|nr:hypothetical protein [Gammaproteobacteria bacterium]